jgi:hypothetical protein
MTQLPKEFAALEPFVATWALPTETERSERRWRSTPAEFQAFYDGMMPHLDRILALLAEHTAADAPANVRTLFRLSLAFAEAAPHTEMYRNSAQVPHSFDARRFVAVHGDRVE